MGSRNTSPFRAIRFGVPRDLALLVVEARFGAARIFVAADHGFPNPAHPLHPIFLR